MKRLPNVHPSDTVKWPNGIGTFDIGAANEGSKILIYNETPLNIQLDFYNGSTDTIHAWEANFWTVDADTKSIGWSIDSDSMNVVLPPINAVYITLYDPKEKLDKTYPFAIIRQLGNIGGVTTNVASTNTLSNEVNTTPTLIIDIGQVANTNLIKVFSDGSFIWNILIGTVVHTLFSGQIAGDGNPLLLGAIGDIAEFLGSAQVNGNLTVAGSSGLVVSSGPIQTTGTAQNIQASGQLNSVAGIISLHSHNCLDFSGANFSLLVPTGANIQAQVNGSAKLVIDSGNVTVSAGLVANNGATISGGSFSCSSGASFSSGLTVNGNSLFLTSGSISRISTGTYSSTTGSKTVNHGLGATPTNVMITGGTSTGTSTSGADTYAATTFTVIDGANGVTQRFRAERS